MNGCDHPWGFDSNRRCCYAGCEMTDAEEQAFEEIERQEIVDAERMKDVPEMQAFLDQDGCTVRIVG